MNNKELISNYYITHLDELLAFTSRRLRGNGDAADIVQDAFVRILTCDKMISDVTLPGLVYTVLRNLITDFYRHHSSCTEYEHYLKCSPRSAETAESVLSVREITEQMERGMARLPEGCQRVYRMHVLNDMRVSEISKATSEGYKWVENRLGIARKAVRNYLKHVS
jgi:RNA polymerase sigma-70 factor (ECF subfamily)